MSTTALRAAATGRPPSNQAAPKSFAGMLEQMKPQIAAALPKHLSPDRMMRIALTCYRTTPALAECSPTSVMAAVVQCAQLGLEPGLLGQAYLLPFKKNTKGPDGKWSSTMECQFIPGYRGLISLARRSGEVTSINAEIVYDNDEFDLTLGVDPGITHRPLLKGDRGSPRLVYGVAKFKDGGHHLEWMTIEEVERIRSRSKAKDNGPWVTDYEQMVKKTVIRRMSKYLPMSVELQNAVQVSEAVDNGQRAVIDGEFVTTQPIEASGEQGGGDTPAGRTYAELADAIKAATPGSELQALLDEAEADLPADQVAELKAIAEAAHGGGE